ncbi:endonuclease/exonuclease/phosphatase family protein [Streptomyces sp. TRM66268-LWL]|uniref:Endonuclease/exonuclease/phosphatase family protein n=1 Tax=Streptomyces polyasparticus TaxID=2767826 RepID=A0ABR7SR63_9ACTN|nr:endonuclease/exonuclease/phosphatase family protein [Streptomyces polyasparticus]MBC9717374.1 endonuclease/exonuclease/phosphatase family protein [Streptomyces polyasparticus]
MVSGTGVRWLAAAVVLVCAAVVGPSAPGGTLAQKPLSPDAVRDIVPNRIATWNICNPCNDSGFNVGRAADIARFAPQVVALQEACVRDVEAIRDHLEYLHGLKYHVEYGSVLTSWNRCGGAPWDPGGYGQAILSAAPMTDRVRVEYPDGGSEDRGYMAVTTEVGGKPVRVFATHLAQRQQAEVRAQQAAVLAKAVAPHERAIVLGDFNAVPSSPELDAMWKLAEDGDPQCHPSASEGQCETTTDWMSKFDYTFVRGIAPVDQGVHRSAWSDHDLVHADVDLNRPHTTR